MTSNRHRHAWIWVAITAIALATVARAQSGYEIARTYANPVIALLSSGQDSQPFSAQHFAQKRTTHGDQAASHGNSDAGFWLEMLPVLFVGLLSQFSLLSAQSYVSVGQAYPAPPLTALFQRPPPAQLL
jgi:hypothetical protein